MTLLNTMKISEGILSFVASEISESDKVLILGNCPDQKDYLSENLPKEASLTWAKENLFLNDQFDTIYVNGSQTLLASLRSIHLLKNKDSKLFINTTDLEYENLSLLEEVFDLTFFKDSETGEIIVQAESKFNIDSERQDRDHSLYMQKRSDSRNNPKMINKIDKDEHFDESYILLSEEDSKRLEVSVPEEKKETQKMNKNTILWVMNVCWRGGTALYVLDAIKSMRSAWHHKVVYINQGANESMYEEFVANNIDISHCPNITKDLLEEISPCAVMLSNTDPNRIEGENPWRWLTDNYLTIYIHHSAVRTWLPNTDTEIFVSNFLLNQYMNLKDRLRRPIIIPPGINTTSYAYIERRLKTNKPTLNIGYLASDNPRKYPKEILDIVYAAVEDSGIKNVAFTVVGGDKHLKDPGGLNYSLKLLPGVDNVINQYRDFDIFLYKSKVQDTWGRNITEAMAAGLPVVTYKGGAMMEQINHKANGFICANDEDYVKYLSQLLSDKELRFEIGSLGRMKAIANFDIRKFAEYVEPIVMKNSWRD